MLLQEAGIPDNVAYLALGMVLLFIIVGGWVASYYWRLRNLKRDLAVLEDMVDEEAPGVTAAAVAMPNTETDSSGVPPNTQPT